MRNNSIIFLKDWGILVSSLSPENQLVFWNLFTNYEYGTEQPCDNLIVKPIWTFIKFQIDNMNTKYNDKVVTRNQHNGAKGGRPRNENPINPDEDKNPNNQNNPNNPVGFSETQKTLNKNVNDNGNENENKNNGANAPVSESAKDVYRKLVKDLNGQEEKTVWIGFRDFINEYKPDFIEPYQEAYNLIAKKYRLPCFEVINDTRKRKLKTRVQEKSFDFIKILEKIRKSDRLLGKDTNSSWKVSFDWIIENQTNYVKILEGNYDN